MTRRSAVGGESGLADTLAPPSQSDLPGKKGFVDGLLDAGEADGAGLGFEEEPLPVGKTNDAGGMDTVADAVEFLAGGDAAFDVAEGVAFAVVLRSAAEAAGHVAPRFGAEVFAVVGFGDVPFGDLVEVGNPLALEPGAVRADDVGISGYGEAGVAEEVVGFLEEAGVVDDAGHRLRLKAEGGWLKEGGRQGDGFGFGQE